MGAFLSGKGSSNVVVVFKKEILIKKYPIFKYGVRGKSAKSKKCIQCLLPRVLFNNFITQNYYLRKKSCRIADLLCETRKICTFKT